MTENEIIELINKRNPQQGIPYNDWRCGTGKKKKYKIYAWMSNDLKEDLFISGVSLLSKLKKYIGEYMTIQLYYDIIVLGILCIEERPKCIICGKPCRFDGLRERKPGSCGYLKTCSKECNKIRKINICKEAVSSGANINDKFYDKINSKEYRENMSNIKKGTIFSQSHKQKISRALKTYRKTEQGIEHGKKLGEDASIRNIEKLKNPTSEYSDLKRVGRYNVGTYISNIWNIKFRFDSSWELKFIKYFETSIKNDVKIFDRCRDVVKYEREDGTVHRYLPDFYVKFKSGLEVVIELKPANLVKKDRVVLLKKIAAKKYFSKKNIKYLVLTENELFNNINGSFNIYDYIV